jgi:hypothetical protein
VLLDLIQAAMEKDYIEVILNAEGPCAESLGLYKILDDICDRTGFSKHKITISTCNLLEKHNDYIVKINPPYKHVPELQQLIGNNSISTKNVNNIDKHFGHFVGHSSRHRLVIASWLFKHHQDKVSQTFHSTITHELHREFIGLEDLWFHGYEAEHIDNAIELFKCVPLRYDSVDDGPILHMKMYGILGAYSNIFLDIVCNTYLIGSTFYMDEKIWRPIITKTPFIVHGPRNFIKNFRKMGFQTFDQWWDEGYSEDHADCQTRAILNIIDQLSKYSVKDIKNLYREMQPVLDHNYEIFMSMDQSIFQKDFIDV